MTQQNNNKTSSNKMMMMNNNNNNNKMMMNRFGIMIVVVVVSTLVVVSLALKRVGKDYWWLIIGLTMMILWTVDYCWKKKLQQKLVAAKQWKEEIQKDLKCLRKHCHDGKLNLQHQRRQRVLQHLPWDLLLDEEKQQQQLLVEIQKDYQWRKRQEALKVGIEVPITNWDNFSYQHRAHSRGRAVEAQQQWEAFYGKEVPYNPTSERKLQFTGINKVRSTYTKTEDEKFEHMVYWFVEIMQDNYAENCTNHTLELEAAGNNAMVAWALTEKERVEARMEVYDAFGPVMGARKRKVVKKAPTPTATTTTTTIIPAPVQQQQQQQQVTCTDIVPYVDPIPKWKVSTYVTAALLPYYPTVMMATTQSSNIKVTAILDQPYHDTVKTLMAPRLMWLAPKDAEEQPQQEDQQQQLTCLDIVPYDPIPKWMLPLLKVSTHVTARPYYPTLAAEQPIQVTASLDQATHTRVTTLMAPRLMWLAPDAEEQHEEEFPLPDVEEEEDNQVVVEEAQPPRQRRRRQRARDQQPVRRSARIAARNGNATTTTPTTTTTTAAEAIKATTTSSSSSSTTTRRRKANAGTAVPLRRSKRIAKMNSVCYKV